MKNILLLIIFFTISSVSYSQQQSITTLILVRHAEKMIDDSKNPDLTTEGKERAARFAAMLANADIAAIYSSSYQRTVKTVRPLADSKKLEIQSYDPRSMDYLEKILKAFKNKTIVISGHSNTIPFAVNRLIGVDQFEQLSEDEYGKIFIVSMTTIGTGKVIVLTY